jgi:hypothetical protein
MKIYQQSAMEIACIVPLVWPFLVLNLTIKQFAEIYLLIIDYNKYILK